MILTKELVWLQMVCVVSTDAALILLVFIDVNVSKAGEDSVAR